MTPYKAFVSIFGDRARAATMYAEKFDLFNLSNSNDREWHPGRLALFTFLSANAPDDCSTNGLEEALHPKTATIVDALAMRLRKVKQGNNVDEHLSNITSVMISRHAVKFNFHNHSVIVGDLIPDEQTFDLSGDDFRKIFLSQF